MTEDERKAVLAVRMVAEGSRGGDAAMADGMDRFAQAAAAALRAGGSTGGGVPGHRKASGGRRRTGSGFTRDEKVSSVYRLL